jgi:hypothetical protein
MTMNNRFGLVFILLALVSGSRSQIVRKIPIDSKKLGRCFKENDLKGGELTYVRPGVSKTETAWMLGPWRKVLDLFFYLQEGTWNDGSPFLVDKEFYFNHIKKDGAETLS